MDIANLGIRVDSSEAVNAAGDLDKLTTASEKVEKATDKATTATAKSNTARKSMNDNVEKQVSAYNKVVDGLNKEYAQLGMTASQRKVDNALRQAGVEATSREGMEIEKAVGIIDKESAALKRNEIVKKAAIGAAVALAAAVATLFVKGISEAVVRLEAERLSLYKFEQAMQKTGGRVTETGAQFKQFANDLQDATGTASTEILALGAKAASFSGSNEVFEKSIALANDLASAYGGTLTENFQRLGRALEDPTRALALFNRNGIALTLTQEKFIETAIKSNDKLRAQEAILKVLGETVGGIAAGSFTGLTAAWVRMGNASETFFNGIVLGTGLLWALEAVLNLISGALTWMGENFYVITEALIVLAPAMIVAFGPTVLGMVLALATTIGVTLFGAVAALWGLLIANPFVAVGLAVLTITSYFIDWQQSIAGLIKIWGNFVYEWYKFWGNEEGMNRGIEIVLNADTAVEEMKGVAETLKEKLTTGFDAGGIDAGNKIKAAMAAGGSAAAAKIGAATKQTAQQTYEALNGVPQKIKGAVQEAGGLVRNEVTGAVEKTGSVMSGNITKAGSDAADRMKKGIEQGGQNAGKALYQNVEQVFANLGNRFLIMQLAINKLTQEINKVQSETALNNANSAKARAEANNLNKRFSSNSGSSGSGGGSSTGVSGSGNSYGYLGTKELTARALAEEEQAVDAGSFARGGSFRVPGAGGSDDKRVSFRATGGERVNVEPPDSQSKKETKVDLHVTNVWDPANMVQAMRTQDGRKELINWAKANRAELAAILGYSG